MKKKRSRMQYAVFMLTLAAILGAVLSCSNPESYNTSYYEQLKLFLSDSEDGRELFTSEIYTSAAFERNGTSELYFYVIDSMISDTIIRIDTIPKNIPPYSGVLDATAEIRHAYFGKIRRIEATGDTVHAYNYRSIISRTAYFVKVYNDGYQYHGWRFWGYNSRTNDASAGRTISNGNFITSVNGQGTEYLLYDTLGIYGKGDSLTYTSNSDDIIFVRTGGDSIKGLKTRLSSGKYKTGWKIGNTTEPFNRLIFVETPVDYVVDTVSESPLVVDTLRINSYGYVAFYKAQ